MLKRAIPVLHVSDAAAAKEFFCRQLGFRLEFAHPGDPSRAEPCYMGLSRDGACIHVSSFSGDGEPGGVVNFVVDDVDELHAELVAKRVPIHTGPVDQTWGTREMYVKDADGNSIRFQQLKQV